jgi:hypothetical protein
MDSTGTIQSSDVRSLDHRPCTVSYSSRRRSSGFCAAFYLICAPFKGQSYPGGQNACLKPVTILRAVDIRHGADYRSDGADSSNLGFGFEFEDTLNTAHRLCTDCTLTEDTTVYMLLSLCKPVGQLHSCHSACRSAPVGQQAVDQRLPQHGPQHVGLPRVFLATTEQCRIVDD